MAMQPLNNVEAISLASGRISVSKEDEIVSSSYRYTVGCESAYVVTSAPSDQSVDERSRVLR